MPLSAFPKTSEVIQKGIEAQMHLGAQIFISVQGDPIADFGIGESRPGVQMKNKTITKWLSAVKPVCAVAVAQLLEKGELELDDEVTRFIPEFGTNGKGGVTIRHLLTHTSGMRHINTKSETWEDLITEVCNVGLYADWVPGKKAGYNVSLGWILLAEILRLVDGRHYNQYARDEILLPLGMDDSWISFSPDLVESYGQEPNPIYTSKEAKLELVDWDQPDEGIYWPGGSARGPVRELGAFYEMLLFGGERNGVRLLTSETIALLTSRHRKEMLDNTFKEVIDWGLGFMIDSKIHHPEGHNYGFGAHASPGTFGHGGYQTSIGFADPDHDLVVSWSFNGLPGDAKHRERNHAMNTAIYEDLGLERSTT